MRRWNAAVRCAQSMQRTWPPHPTHTAGLEQRRYRVFKVPMWYRTLTNEFAVLEGAEAARLGQTALVIGGTGVVGQHICNMLSTKHATVVSISPEGAPQQAMETELNFMDLVKWVEGDVADPEMWSDLTPVVRETVEVYFALPRTQHGAELTINCLRRLASAVSAVRKVCIASVPPFWRGVDQATREAWKEVEETAKQLFPDGCRILQFGEVYDFTGVGELPPRLTVYTARFLRPFYRLLLRDNIGRLRNILAHEQMSLIRYTDTPLSGLIVPPVDVLNVAFAAVAPELPDLEGGRLVTVNTYAITVLPHFNLHALITGRLGATLNEYF
eukprot:Sspe_Gene.66318::Locus_39184_Transcript_2_2_Confidence_0.333_Length_1058::g.66318::m.66318